MTLPGLCGSLLMLTMLAACASPGPRPYKSNENLAGDPVIQAAPGADPGVEVLPQLIQGRAPVYPITRALDERGGAATIAFVVDEAGVPRQLRVVRADHESYGRHLLVAAREWRFSPARHQGQVVPFPLELTWRFLGPKDYDEYRRQQYQKR